MDRPLNPGAQQQLAVIFSRQELHKRIDALPDNAEILLLTNVPHATDGKRDDFTAVDCIGFHPAIINERVAWLLQTALAWLFSGVCNRGR